MILLFNKGKKISIATDLGHTNSRIINTVMDSDLIMLEANHDVDMLMGLLSPAPKETYFGKQRPSFKH